MNNHYLRFPTKAAMDAALSPFKNSDGYLVPPGDCAIDVIGQIVTASIYDDQGNVVVPAITLNGWHVNWLGDLPTELSEYEVFPENPVRVWA